MRKIGGISDVMIEIEEMMANTDLTVDEIAERLNVPVEWVNAATDLVQDYNDYNDSLDGDFDSAMTSAGFGTDEDYGYYGE